MKLYYSPLACSLADPIALLEAGASFERERVDLKTKRVASGGDFTAVTRKGYVPALVLDSDEVLIENIAVLDWIAAQTLDRLEAIQPQCADQPQPGRERRGSLRHRPCPHITPPGNGKDTMEHPRHEVGGNF